MSEGTVDPDDINLIDKKSISTVDALVIQKDSAEDNESANS